jgi:hypothetical protein
MPIGFFARSNVEIADVILSAFFREIRVVRVI